jgi:hypothetical protein
VKLAQEVLLDVMAAKVLRDCLEILVHVVQQDQRANQVPLEVQGEHKK